MRAIDINMDDQAVDRIIDHLGLVFVAAKPPLPGIAMLVAAQKGDANMPRRFSQFY